MHQPDVLIIGAGMAGLCAARELRAAGREVVLLEKGRGVGGRMASRRIGDATFDHGAQFFTTRAERFQALVATLQSAGAAAEWCHGFSGHEDGHVRWRGAPTMNAVAKALAGELVINTKTRVASLRRAGDFWQAETTTGEIFMARAAVLTPPVPQALALLEEVALAPEMRARLTRIEYERCLAVMAVLAQPSRIPSPGALSPQGEPIAWIADNQQKGVSGMPAVTIHATAAFSCEHWERDRNESGRLLLDAAAEWVGHDVKVFQVHGWRYSKPVQVDEQPCAILHEEPPLILAGDAFAGPRVEGAALSGWAAAAAILASR